MVRLSPELLDQLEAVHHRHVGIGDDERECLPASQLQSLLAVRGLYHRKARPLDGLRNQLPDDERVIHDQRVLRHFLSPLTSWGARHPRSDQVFLEASAVATGGLECRRRNGGRGGDRERPVSAFDERFQSDEELHPRTVESLDFVEDDDDVTPGGDEGSKLLPERTGARHIGRSRMVTSESAGGLLEPRIVSSPHRTALPSPAWGGDRGTVATTSWLNRAACRFAGCNRQECDTPRAGLNGWPSSSSRRRTPRTRHTGTWLQPSCSVWWSFLPHRDAWRLAAIRIWRMRGSSGFKNIRRRRPSCSWRSRSWASSHSWSAGAA